MGGAGSRARRVRAVLGAVVAFGVVAAACGSGTPTESPAEAPPARTIAFLRAVRSIQPENQAAFLEALADGGYVEGENLRLIARDLDEVYPDAATSEAAVSAWVDEDVDLIVALSTVGSRAAMAAAPTTPVLFLVNDPITTGLVDNPRHPGGQATGATFRVPPDRTLDVARRAFGAQAPIGVVYPPDDPAARAIIDEAARAATALGMDLRQGPFRGEDDAANAVSRLVAEGARAIWVLNSPTSIRFIQEIAAAASSVSIPLISNTAVTTAAVILQPDTVELYRQIARQALQLFDGRAIREIPVENPAGFVLEVNLPAARAIGLELPASLVEQADRVQR